MKKKDILFSILLLTGLVSWLWLSPSSEPELVPERAADLERSRADEDTDICYKEQEAVKKDFLDIYFVVKNKAKRRRGYAYVPPAL